MTSEMLSKTSEMLGGELIYKLNSSVPENTSQMVEVPLT